MMDSYKGGGAIAQHGLAREAWGRVCMPACRRAGAFREGFFIGMSINRGILAIERWKFHRSITVLRFFPPNAVRR